MKTIKAIDYSDPSHGWRAVSKKDLMAVGCAGLISPYSYQSKTKVYLEEDRDLTIFMQFAREKGYHVIVSKHSYSHNPSPVRQKERYNNPQWAHIESVERFVRG